MQLNEKLKEKLLIVTYAIVLIFALFNLKTMFGIIIYVLKLFMPFIIGIGIAFILNILLKIIEAKVYPKIFKKKTKRSEKLKRPICLVSVMILLVALISLIFKLVIPEFINAVEIFSESLPKYTEIIEDYLEEKEFSEENIKMVTDTLNEVQKKATSFVMTNTDEIAERIFDMATKVVGYIVNGVIALVFALYIIAQKEKITYQVNKVMRAFLDKKIIDKIDTVVGITNKAFYNFASGQFVEALIIGVLCFIGMIILRIPYAPTISVLVAFTALIPMFGAFIGTIIGAFLILMIDPIKAIIFIIFIIILQQFEGNLIYPKVVGRSVGLPGIWVLVAVTIGASTFGIIGMIISVPLCAILYGVLVNRTNERLKKGEKVNL